MDGARGRTGKKRIKKKKENCDNEEKEIMKN